MVMAAYLAGMLISFSAALLATYTFRHVARKRGWLDHPNAPRKIHTRPIPQVGGIAMVAASLVGLLFFVILAKIVGIDLDFPGLTILAGAFVIVLTGVLDDLLHLNARKKIFGQVVASGLVIAGGFVVHFPEWILFGINFGWITSVLFTLLWMVGIMNAVNLLDGMDGLAAGVILIGFSALTIVYALAGQVPNPLIVCIIVGSLLGFLAFNFHPASIFMGDTGSLFLGFSLSLYAFPAFTTGSLPASYLVPVLALGIPILDTITSISRRMLTGQKIFDPDKDHLHHRLFRVTRLSHRDTVLALYGGALIFGLAAVVYSVVSGWGKVVLLLVLWAGIHHVFKRLGYIPLRKAFGEKKDLLKQDPGTMAGNRDVSGDGYREDLPVGPYLNRP